VNRFKIGDVVRREGVPDARVLGIEDDRLILGATGAPLLTWSAPASRFRLVSRSQWIDPEEWGPFSPPRMKTVPSESWNLNTAEVYLVAQFLTWLALTPVTGYRGPKWKGPQRTVTVTLPLDVAEAMTRDDVRRSLTAKDFYFDRVRAACREALEAR